MHTETARKQLPCLDSVLCSSTITKLVD